jgi:rubrerythrin
MTTLPSDKALVFYCRSGARSMAAAAMVDDEGVSAGGIYNLAGGILAWDGALTADFPRIDLFDLHAPPAEMLRGAMNLEKGALRFYRYVGRQYAGREWSDVFDRLSTAEMGHARMVYHHLARIDPAVPDFDTLFDALGGEVLEGGMSLEKAVERAAAAGDGGRLPLIEMALQIEYAAFDLYRNMADRSPAPDAREAFLTIAQAEKNHMRVLIKELERRN